MTATIRKPRKHSARWFWEFFSAIPEDKWLRSSLGSIPDGPHCALGHLGVDSSYEETEAVRKLAKLIVPGLPAYLQTSKLGAIETVYCVNDKLTDVDNYTFNPRANILGALRKAIRKQKKKVPV